MSPSEIEKTIEQAFEQRDGVGPSTKGAVRDAVEAALDLLDSGKARVAGAADLRLSESSASSATRPC